AQTPCRINSQPLRETKHLAERDDYTTVGTAVRTWIGALTINWRKLRGSMVRTADPTATANDEGRLRQHFANHLAVDVRQSALDAVVVEGQLLVVETQQVEHRGVEVVP